MSATTGQCGACLCVVLSDAPLGWRYIIVMYHTLKHTQRGDRTAEHRQINHGTRQDCCIIRTGTDRRNDTSCSRVLVGDALRNPHTTAVKLQRMRWVPPPSVDNACIHREEAQTRPPDLAFHRSIYYTTGVPPAGCVPRTDSP